MLTEEEIREKLGKLRAERTSRIESEFKRRKEESDELEKRGQESLKALTKVLKEQKINIAAIQAIGVPSKEPLEKRVEKIRERMRGLARRPSNEDRSVISSISLSTTVQSYLSLTPYYTHIYDYGGGSGWTDLPWEGEDFSGYYSGPIGVMWWVKGGGTGNFGTGASRMTGIVDRWFFFNPDVTRYYSFTVYEPFYGFYIVEAHDGDLTSKRASVSIETRIHAYQYNWLSEKEYSIFSRGGRNINESERFDTTRTFYYSELLGGGDVAFLLVSQVFVVYARGQYSYAEWNFSKGSANYLPAPYVHVY